MNDSALVLENITKRFGDFVAVDGVTRVVATLIGIDPLTILAQPASRTNNVGTLAAFTVSAGGAGVYCIAPFILRRLPA